MKDNIKKAVESAEQEIQEKEIEKLKGIVKELLIKKASKEEEKRDIEKEISVIKQTIDDFKAGRLDKVKELIEKDSVARQVLPFQVIIINQTIYNQPWRWEYRVEPISLSPTASWSPSSGLIAGGSGVMSLTNYTGSYNTGTGLTGNCYATFTSGSYDIGDRIINL